MDNGMEERLLIGSQVEDRSDLKGRIWEESKKIWSITFPSMLFRVTTYGILVVTQTFMGHISELDLAAYALVQTLCVQFVNGVLIGMSSATETLCGQAFGAGQYYMMGIYLQRSWIVNLATATILIPVFIFMTPILRALGQDEEIAKVAGNISLWFIPILYSSVFIQTIQMYLQAQVKNMPIGWLSTFTFVLHVLLSWIFVSKLNWGIPGAMGAMIISRWLLVFGGFGYIFGGWCPNTWGGFTKAAFVDLWPVVKLSISSGVMLCLELWYNAVLILLAGYMKNATVALSAISICLNISQWQFMVCLGFLGASCVRVSNELGRGNAKAAKFSIKVIFCTSACFGVLFWILCFFWGREISYLFTSDEEVVKSVSSLSIFLAFTLLLNSIQSVLTGVAIGAGWQAVVAFVNVTCYYAIGIPIGALLGYVAHLQIKGLWLGMICGVVIQTLVLIYMTWRTDWNDQVNKTLERVNRWSFNPEEEYNKGNMDGNAVRNGNSNIGAYLHDMEN